MTWSLQLRVTGEGGVSRRGRKRNGKSHRVTLGEYRAVTLEAARSTANAYLDQAKRGMSPVAALESAATAGGLTVQELATVFIGARDLIVGGGNVLPPSPASSQFRIAS